MKEKLLILANRKNALHAQLIAPARAAANQMKDAGMTRGAEPLLEILFQIDAIEDEVKALFAADPKASVEAIIQLMAGK